MILYIWEVLYPSQHSLDPDVIFIVTTYMDSRSLSLFFCDSGQIQNCVSV